MRELAIALGVLVIGAAGSALAGSARAEPTASPPMNTTDEAYYLCAPTKDAFVVQYPDAHPSTATLITDNQTKYALTKSPVSQGFMFTSKAGVQFWTDGTRVSLTGASHTYTDCARQ